MRTANRKAISTQPLFPHKNIYNLIILCPDASNRLIMLSLLTLRPQCMCIEARPLSWLCEVAILSQVVRHLKAEKERYRGMRYLVLPVEFLTCFFFLLRPQRFQAMLNTKPRCTLIIGHAIDKIRNQCTR